MLLRVERRDYDLILFCPNCGFRRVVKWDDTIIVQDGVEDDFEDRIRVWVDVLLLLVLMFLGDLI